ncbi:MAG: hypothetical protein IJ833_08200 [Lachnospiraceae bacterium]|nr:hypothetical protein [Lachnospiraceae bacterium]
MSKKKKKKRNQKQICGADVLCAVCFLGLLLLGMTLSVVTRDIAFSAEENRSLTRRPELTWETLSSGKYADGVEKWLGDQFVARSLLRRLHIVERLAGGEIEAANVLLGAEGQLVEKLAVPDWERVSRNIEAMGQFAGDYPKVDCFMMLVPDSGELLRDCLPSYLNVGDQKGVLQEIHGQLSEEIHWVDGWTALYAHKRERIYYKTDHHWTTLGAYYGYEALREAREQGNKYEDVSGEWRMERVTDSFRGVLARNSGFAWNETESIEIYIPAEPTPLTVTYPEEQKRSTSLYDIDKLNGVDQYAVFLGGNSALVDIRTASEADRTILVVKDSFANCFLPFLVQDYGEIVVVDPRYYAGSAKDVMRDFEVDEVLFLYRGNTFVQDNHLYGFLE